MANNPYILRRPRLGRTSTPAIARLSTTGITSRRNPRHIPSDCDLVIRWGCTSNVPTRNVINTAVAIHEVNDKVGFRRKLNEAGLCPKTWFDLYNIPSDYPFVVRPANHSRGRHLYVCENSDQLRSAIRRCGDGWYASELINKTAEYRVFVAQGRCIAVANKIPGNPEDVGWNVALGGRFENVRWEEWPIKAIKYSIEAFNLSSLDFGGVDVMVDGDGNCYVLEINSAPSLTSPYRQECMTKALDWMVINGKERIPLVEERGGTYKFIHPCLTDSARLV